MQWDLGVGTWTSLIGETYNSLSATFTVTGLTPGNVYNFRYRALNIFGWGAYSGVSSITAATAPAQMTAPTTSISGNNVVISWTLPNIKGSAI